MLIPTFSNNDKSFFYDSYPRIELTYQDFLKCPGEITNSPGMALYNDFYLI